jgi:hypothetical protein
MSGFVLLNMRTTSECIEDKLQSSTAGGIQVLPWLNGRQIIAKIKMLMFVGAAVALRWAK